MKNELRTKVENELKKAYAYFGEYDEELMRERAAEEVETLACRIKGTAPETINVGNEKLIGYTIDVELASYNPEATENVVRNGKTYTKEQIKVLELVVTKSELVYVIHTYDTYKPEDWVFGDDFECDNEIYERVNLEDVDVATF